LASNRARTRQLTSRLRQQGVNLGDACNTLSHDDHSLLHWNHIRDGSIGSWRDQASPEQTVLLGQICGHWLIEHGYEMDNTWMMPAFQAIRDGLRTCQAELCRAGHRLANLRAELRDKCRQLQGLEQLGPVALGLARRFHDLSVGHPRLSGTVKQLMADWCGVGANMRNASAGDR
jgi:hypothetical protein